MTHRVTLQSTLQITPDTTHYVFTRPPEYEFVPGQATDLALDRDGWRDEARPFTFVGDPDANLLAFVIKSYPDRDGVTARLPELEPGDTVLIDEPWGAFKDEGPGTFIAAGTGITPFIGILKQRARRHDLDDCRLLYANKTRDDIILRPFWCGLKSLEARFPLSAPNEPAANTHIDAAFLSDAVEDFDQRFYLCGPPEFEESVESALVELGADKARILREA